MSFEAVDRNVLFGVLAWQLGVVERETLMSAMYTWMTDKSRSLPDVLAAAGELSADDRRWVNEAVDRQLKKNDSDPAKTLANLNSVDDVCRKLREIAEGRATAETIAAPEQVDNVAKTRVPRHTVHDGKAGGDDFEVAGDAAPRSERFRIVRPLARGGLGEVFVAVDEELKREVALKQILSRHADSKTSRARFLLEAEVTGCLEHPGVVPVYGLGVQDDGRPYYAMRFIRGESLEDAIRKFHEANRDPLRDSGQRTVELRNLLTRFVAVCNTIEYAHSRGIVHRDLKPENIMLGPYGETLVVDWGLGRQMERQAGDLDEPAVSGDLGPANPSVERPTMMGSVVGTPQFMSPEQASGRLDLIRAASDVYSLGATLYALLTDQPPFVSADVRKVLRDVQTGKFPSPRQIRRDTPRGLEAICLKAMALRPEDRYSSAHLLADDIEHWLADEPVAALSETPVERAQRWMRRHRTLARAAAAALVVIAGVAWFAYAREAVLRNDLQIALTQEEKAKQEAVDARQLAVKNADMAEQERRRAEAHAHRAEQQSSLALATLKSVLFDIQAKLKNVPAAHAVRLSMLTTVIDGLKQVARSLETADDTDHSLVRAHLDLGDIFLQVGGGESAGATAEAQGQYERGVEVADKLYRNNPKSVPSRVDLASAYQRMGDVSMQRGNLTAGTDWLKKSLDLRRQLVDESAADAVLQRDLAASLQRLGMVYQQVGDFVVAQDFYAKFFDLSQQIAQRDPKNVEDRRNLSVSYERMGDIRLVQGKDREAEDFFKKSLEVRRALADEDANNAVARRDLSVTLDRLGDLAQKRGDGDAAVKLFEESLVLRKKLSEDDPHNAQAQRDLLVSYAALGDAALGKQELEKTADYYRQYHELAQKLAAGDPDNIQLQRDLATSFDRQGYAMSQSGKREEAREFYRKSHELLKKLADADPSNQRIQRDLAAACATLGDLTTQLNDFAAARGYFAEQLAVARQRMNEHAEDQASRREVIDALLRNGDLHLRLLELPAAAAELTEVIEGAQRAVTADPGDIGSRMSLANALGMLAQYDVLNRDPDSAAKHLQSSIAEMRRAVEKTDAVLQAQVTTWIKAQESLATLCTTAKTVIADPDAVAKQAEGDVPDLLDFAAAARLRAGKIDEARELLERLAKLEPADGAKRMLAARRYAAAAGLKSTGSNHTEFAEQAMNLLREAHKLKAFEDAIIAAQLEFAADFAPLRDRDDFKALLAQVRNKK